MKRHRICSIVTNIRQHRPIREPAENSLTDISTSCH